MEQEMRNWQRERWAEQAIKNLRKKLFCRCLCGRCSRGLGAGHGYVAAGGRPWVRDSLTLKEIGVLRALEERGGNLLNPWRPGIGREESMALRRRAFTADVFLTGTNALTLDGKLVNIDGLGNRVAAMIFGPKKVIVVAGINKVVKDVEEALWRIKNIAAPVNARKHDFPAELRPPCSDGGFCRDCAPAPDLLQHRHNRKLRQVFPFLFREEQGLVGAVGLHQSQLLLEKGNVLILQRRELSELGAEARGMVFLDILNAVFKFLAAGLEDFFKRRVFKNQGFFFPCFPGSAVHPSCSYSCPGQHNPD